MKLKRHLMCITALVLSLTMLLTAPNLCSACEEKRLAFLSSDIERITLTNGGTGRTIYLESDEDLEKVVSCLNSFDYKEKMEAADSVGYQYMLRIEFRESDNAPLSFQFTPNSIWVDGELFISDKPMLSEIISFLPREAVNLFKDVSSDDSWYNDIKYAVENGIFYGASHTHFEPEASLNRAMAVTILHRLAGCPDEGSRLSFQDVENDAWYKKAVDWASRAKIVSGTGENAFSPSGSVTREQMALMMYRYAQLKSTANASGDLLNYPDAGQVSPWAKEAMEWSVRAGMIRCKLDAASQKAVVLDPQGEVSRADAAGMLRRLNQYLHSSNGAV